MPTASVVKILLDTVVDELGILRPSGYVGSQDIANRQLVALFHQVGDYIVNQHEWQALIKLTTFNTAPGENDYGLPGDWAGFINETMWNNTGKVQVLGPRNQRDWAAVETSRVSIGPYYVQQLRGDKIILQPTPTGYDQITYYYLSGDWVRLAAGGFDDRAASDLDKTVWSDDRMIIAGVKAAWLRAKRLSYDEEWDLFQKQIRNNIAIDRGADTLSMDPARQGRLITHNLVVPLGNWPL